MDEGPDHQHVEEEEIDGEVLADLNDDDPNMEEDDGEDGDEGDEGDAAADEGDGQQEQEDIPMAEEDDASIHVFEGHTDAVLAVAWSPIHPDLVATGGQDDAAFLWRVGQEAYERTQGTLSTSELSGHTDSVASVAFNSKGSLLATGGMEGVVKIWSAENGSLVQTLEGPGGSVDWVRWHPKGDVLLAGSEDFTLWMWLALTGTCMQVFAGHQGPVTSGGFTQDGKSVVSTGGEDDCSLRVWNPKTGECQFNINGHNFHSAGITCSSIHHDSTLVITGAEDGGVRVSNIVLGKSIGNLEGHEDSVESVGFSFHQPLVASAGVDGKLIIHELSSLSQRGVIQHPEAITKLAWHPNQPLVFSACLDGMVRCWDLRTAASVKSWGGHGAPVQDIALSPDGRFIITGSDDKTARIFEL